MNSLQDLLQRRGNTAPRGVPVLLSQSEGLYDRLQRDLSIKKKRRDKRDGLYCSLK